MYASNWLQHAQCALAICTEYANKANHMLILPIELNQVLNNEKSQKIKKAILTLSSGPQASLKQIFW